MEAAAAGSLILAGAALLWREPEQRKALFIGGLSAWAASSVGTAALLAAKASSSMEPFWWAFGGGMGLRLILLVILAVYGYGHESLSQSALLLSYAFGVLFFLLLEYRHIKIK